MLPLVKHLGTPSGQQIGANTIPLPSLSGNLSIQPAPLKLFQDWDESNE
jgi:hypothetical protein